jgi:16S rRNA (cytosine967-C5)-methyltransferase
MPVSVARKIAFEILLRVESEGAFTSDLLHAKLTPAVKSGDAGLATALTLGVLRWKRLLDFLIARHVKKPVAKLDLEVLLALRLGLYQLRFLQRVPARAAVNESVEMVKASRKSSAAAMVNAVLRRLAGDSALKIADLLPPGTSDAERLGLLHSHPTWMVGRWLARFGSEQTARLLQHNNSAPITALAIHGRDRAEIERSLQNGGFELGDGKLLRDSMVVAGGNIAQSDAFRNGAISIQDEASQLVATLLGVRAGDAVLDLCAAPGGKTALLARAAGAEGGVVAGDLHTHRLRVMRSQLERLKAADVSLVALDGTQALPLGQAFDRILVDAPCSGTGTLARNPEIRWRLRAEDLPDLQRRQAALLRSALGRLKPGGRLVYSTCSLEPEENSEVVRRVLAGLAEVRAVPAQETAKSLQPSLATGIQADQLFDADGFLQTFPPDHDTDGFFAAILTSTREPSARS